jgi:hypothetical protein
MGGSCGRGNTGPVSEFNIQVDPEAAAVVFAAGVPLTMVPLEVTHTAVITPAVLDRVAYGGADVSAAEATAPDTAPAGASPSSGGAAAGAALDASSAATPFRRLLVSLLQFFASTYATVFGMPHPPLHDPCAVFFVIDRAAFTGRACHVDIDTSAGVSAGQTVVDLLNINKHDDSAKNATVALAMDVPRFWRAMLEAVAAADAHSGMNAGVKVPALSSAASYRSQASATAAAAVPTKTGAIAAEGATGLTPLGGGSAASMASGGTTASSQGPAQSPASDAAALPAEALPVADVATAAQ